MSIRVKIENIWYHYKTYIIAAAFLLGTLIVCLHSCVTKPEYDIQVYYVTGASAIYNEQLAWIESAVAKHCGDTNQDGEITVAVTGLKVGPNTDPTERAKYLNAVQAGEVMLLFGDEAGINYLYQNGFLQPLTDYSNVLDGNGYAWNISNSVFSTQTEGFDLFGETQVYLSLRIFEDTWSSKLSNGKRNFEIAENTLRSIMEAGVIVKE